MQKNNPNEQKRKRAIELFNKKYSVSEICKTLNCSRRWFYKWLKRYRNNPSGRWYLEESGRPKTNKKKTDNQTEQLIPKTRVELIKSPYMQYGPQAI